MLRVFVGEDRVSAESAIRRALGANYEVFEGENLSVDDLPSLFMGVSLFDQGKRRIVIKNLAENTPVWAKIVDYAQTEHEVIIWELKVDKRSVGYKGLKEAKVEIKEFPLRGSSDVRMMFGVLDLAFRDGGAAVAMVEKIEKEQDPYMFLGLLVTQALKRFTQRGGTHERMLLVELGKLDLELKSSSFEPWTLIKAFLMRVQSF